MFSFLNAIVLCSVFVFSVQGDQQRVEKYLDDVKPKDWNATIKKLRATIGQKYLPECLKQTSSKTPKMIQELSGLKVVQDAVTKIYVTSYLEDARKTDEKWTAFIQKLPKTNDVRSQVSRVASHDSDAEDMKDARHYPENIEELSNNEDVQNVVLQIYAANERWVADLGSFIWLIKLSIIVFGIVEAFIALIIFGLILHDTAYGVLYMPVALTGVVIFLCTVLIAVLYLPQGISKSTKLALQFMWVGLLGGFGGCLALWIWFIFIEIPGQIKELDMDEWNRTSGWEFGTNLSNLFLLKQNLALSQNSWEDVGSVGLQHFFNYEEKDWQSAKRKSQANLE